MKINQNCDSKPVGITSITLGDIPPGTVFLYGDHKWGPYIRTSSGIFEAQYNEAYIWDKSNPISNYKELPNARLVLE